MLEQAHAEAEEAKKIEQSKPFITFPKIELPKIQLHLPFLTIGDNSNSDTVQEIEQRETLSLETPEASEADNESSLGF